MSGFLMEAGVSIAQTGIHGYVQGILSLAQGGTFEQAFVAGLNHVMHQSDTSLPEKAELTSTDSENSPKDIILLNVSNGAGGKGHNGVIIGNDKDGYIYMASDGRVDTSGSSWMGG